MRKKVRTVFLFFVTNYACKDDDIVVHIIELIATYLKDILDDVELKMMVGI